MTAEQLIAAYQSMTAQQKHAFFAEVARAECFPQAVRKAASEAAVDFTRASFDKRLAEFAFRPHGDFSRFIPNQ